uniref:Uncharacterized protein n=1 Tax=Plectus sambesii TaxID=2011161 RepID=A0A914VKI9_9BILA
MAKLTQIAPFVRRITSDPIAPSPLSRFLLFFCAAQGVVSPGTERESPAIGQPAVPASAVVFFARQYASGAANLLYRPFVYGGALSIEPRVGVPPLIRLRQSSNGRRRLSFGILRRPPPLHRPNITSSSKTEIAPTSTKARCACGIGRPRRGEWKEMVGRARAFCCTLTAVVAKQQADEREECAHVRRRAIADGSTVDVDGGPADAGAAPVYSVCCDPSPTDRQTGRGERSPPPPPPLPPANVAVRTDELA